MSAILGLQPLNLVPKRPANPSGLVAVPRPKSFIAELIESAQEHDAELPAAEAVPVPAARPKKTYPMPLGARLALRAIDWIKKNRTFSANKQLRVSDTVSLGEKRFVAVVHIDGKKFLIGGGSSGVSLLTQLGATEEEQPLHADSGQAE